MRNQQHLICFCRFAGPPELQDWTEMAELYDNLKDSVSVVIQLLIVFINSFGLCVLNIN
jgi:hypothetical protein